MSNNKFIHKLNRNTYSRLSQKNPDFKHYPFKPLQPKFIKKISTKINQSKHTTKLSQSLDRFARKTKSYFSNPSFGDPQLDLKNMETHENWNKKYSCQHRKIRAYHRKNQSKEDAHHCLEQKRNKIDLQRVSSVFRVDETIFTDTFQPMPTYKQLMYGIISKQKLQQNKNEGQYQKIVSAKYTNNYPYFYEKQGEQGITKKEGHGYRNRESRVRNREDRVRSKESGFISRNQAVNQRDYIISRGTKGQIRKEID